MISYILCVAAGENRDKFDHLRNISSGWGIDRLSYTSTDVMSVAWTKSRGINETLVVINDVVAYLPGKRLDGPEATQLLKRGLHAAGVPDKHVIELKGSETPEEIEDVVRQRMAELLVTKQ